MGSEGFGWLLFSLLPALWGVWCLRNGELRYYSLRFRRSKGPGVFDFFIVLSFLISAIGIFSGLPHWLEGLRRFVAA